jgi:chloramphenicol O-acetyltransferase
MESFGRKIFFDKTNGDVIFDTGERIGTIPTTIEHDVQAYTVLSIRNRDTFDVLELEFGDHAQDFAECNSYRVNVANKTLEFSYPDPNEPTAPPVYQKPLSEQVSALSEQLKSADEKYHELNVTSADLTTLKSAKMSQLEEACSSAITSGFDFTVGGTSYKFSCSLEAQANFQGADTLFKDGSITEAEWTVVNNANGKIERVALDIATFNSIKLQVFTHINSKISRLRNTLQPLVESATTNADVDAVVW